jgi:hypothetical protein
MSHDYTDLIAWVKRCAGLAPQGGGLHACLKSSADAIEALVAERDRLTAALARSNSQAEHFEREWYLRGDELETLSAERDAAVADARLSAFGAWAAEQFRDELGDVDGGSAQDAMERLGVLVPVTVTEPCGDECRCAEYGDWPMQCYRYPDDVRAAIDAAIASTAPPP